MRIRFYICLLLSLIVIGLFSPVAVFSAPTGKIQQLKNLYIDTDLVSKGKVRAVIITPLRYEKAANALRNHVRKLTGVNLPIYNADVVPEEIL